MLESSGSLDVVRWEDDALTLEGWAASRGHGPVDAFKVTLRGRELPLIEAELGRPSPDVKAAFPDLDRADACRFSLRCGLDAEQRRIAETSVIALTPLFQGKPGKVQIHLTATSLPEPSTEDINMIGVGFLDVSKEFLLHFLQLADLKSDARVLDVGCGVGRMAYMLAHYLQPDARYEGFDIIDQLVDWASAKISPQYPNFHFQKADVYNKHYNPTGAYKASKFRFPFEDESFDFIFLTSVFTHMFGNDVRHYLDEFNRVLRPNGRCLTTCFLLNEESTALIREGKSTQNLAYPVADCFTSNPADPEDATGFKEPLLLQWIKERGFELEEKRYGSWCGRPEFLSYQDILVYRKIDTIKSVDLTSSLFGRALRSMRSLVRS